MFAWIIARSDNARLGKQRSTVPLSFVYTDFVKAKSASNVNVPPHLTEMSTYGEWATALEYLDSRVICLALLQPEGSYDITKLLTNEQRYMVDY